MKVLVALEDRFGMKFGKLQRSSRPEYVVYDPIAKISSKYNGQVTVEDIGKVNASGPLHIGEFEFHDPRAAAEYMAMPKRLSNIEQEIQEILKLLKEKHSDSS